MSVNVQSRILRVVSTAGIALAAVVIVGTLGYLYISGGRASCVDSLYMTVITITTIGYSEIIDLSGNPAGRIFTIFIAVAGVSIGTFFFTNLIAVTVEAQLSYAFRRSKMEKKIRKLHDHFIVCGAGAVGTNVLRELFATRREHVLIDRDKAKLEHILDRYPEELFIEGDATDSDILTSAGVDRAKGVFAVTGDDNMNLVVSLSAKQLNPYVRVVARCRAAKNMDKMKKAGADAVISPSAIGALRMASAMVRPSVVTFLDRMLRETERGLRIEEIPVPDGLAGKLLMTLGLPGNRYVLLLAVARGGDFIFNPAQDLALEPGDMLIVMTTPEERSRFEETLRAK